MSWHPHPTIYPCELWDCSLLSWHQHRERTYSGVVFWTGSDRDAVVIVRQNERTMEFAKEAEGRPKGAVDARER